MRRAHELLGTSVGPVTQLRVGNYGGGPPGSEWVEFRVASNLVNALTVSENSNQAMSLTRVPRFLIKEAERIRDTQAVTSYDDPIADRSGPEVRESN